MTTRVLPYLVGAAATCFAIAAACSRQPSAVAEASPAVLSLAEGTPVNGRIEIRIKAEGYEPASIRTKKGQPLVLVFFRADANNCGEEVVFPSLNIRHQLPVGQRIEVTVTPTTDELRFTCGMGMYKGKIIAQ